MKMFAVLMMLALIMTCVAVYAALPEGPPPTGFYTGDYNKEYWHNNTGTSVQLYDYDEGPPPVYTLKHIFEPNPPPGQDPWTTNWYDKNLGYPNWFLISGTPGQVFKVEKLINADTPQARWVKVVILTPK